MEETSRLNNRETNNRSQGIQDEGYQYPLEKIYDSSWWEKRCNKYRVIAAVIIFVIVIFCSQRIMSVASMRRKSHHLLAPESQHVEEMQENPPFEAEVKDIEPQKKGNDEVKRQTHQQVHQQTVKATVKEHMNQRAHIAQSPALQPSKPAEKKYSKGIIEQKGLAEPVAQGVQFKAEGPSINTQILYSQIKNKQYDLWEMSTQEKLQLLQYLPRQQVLAQSQLDYTPPVRHKDEEAGQYMTEFEKDSKVIDWKEIEISAQQSKELSIKHQRIAISRRKTMEGMQKTYEAKYKGNRGYMEYNKGILYSHFLQTIKLRKITGQHKQTPEIEDIAKAQKDYFRRKYRVDEYEKQFKMCVVVPTYNNEKNQRYVWNIESLLQQDYENYTVVIIDDNSSDKTVQLTTKYLKWRNADPKKFHLVSSSKRRTALENLYYGAHRYCDYGEVFMMVDGDDELIGTQVFKLFNAFYQKTHSYTVYSNFMEDASPSHNPLKLGISEDYPSFVKSANSYRWFKHSYSHLRTIISDLFLLQRRQSLTDPANDFYQILYDNALYYPAMEQSCGKVSYVPELLYWYGSNTGSNDWKKIKSKMYQDTYNGILEKKPYVCIEDLMRKVDKEFNDKHK